MNEGMNIENAILKSISINCKSVSVPAEVTRIGKEAFKGCTSLKEMFLTTFGSKITKTAKNYV